MTSKIKPDQAIFDAIKDLSKAFNGLAITTQQAAEMAAKLAASGVITVNEFRKSFGLPPIEDVTSKKAPDWLLEGGLPEDDL